MPTIAEIRQQYPQYSDMSDEALASALHSKFYADMPKDQFMAKVGLAPTAQPKPPGDGRPWYAKLGSAADDMARIAANGMTFGFADKLAGWAGGEGTAAERARTDAARERAGMAGNVAEIGGGLATGLGLSGMGLTAASLVPKGVTGFSGLGARTAAMAGEGAAYGAANALGYDQDVGTGAALGAGAGALGNVAGEAIAKGIGSVAGAFNKQPQLPTADQIKAAKTAAYKASEDAGVILKPDVVQGIRDKVREDLANFAYLPANQPRIKAVLDELDRVSGGNITLKGLDQIRKQAGDAFDPMNRASNSIASKIIQRIDEGVTKISPDAVLTGDATAGVEALSKARALNTQASKIDRITEALTKAERNAQSSGSGGNVDNTTRQQIKSLLNSPTRSRGFTSDEKEAMEQIIRGTDTQNVLRLAGKLSPSGNGLMAALGIGAAAANPVLAAAPAVGLVAKTVSDGATRKNVDDLVRIISAGGKRSDAFSPPNAVQRLAETKREALIRALLGAGLLGARSATVEQP